MKRFNEEIEESKTKYFWIAVFTEFIGTIFFIFLVTAVVVNFNPTNASAVIAIAFAIGLSISVLAQIFGPVGGAHFNPAVTIALLVKGDIGIIRTICYIVVQLIAGIIGAAVTYGITPSSRRGQLGALGLSAGLTQTQGFVVECILTMLLVFTVLGSTSSDHNRKDHGYSNALAIGISITVAHLIGIPYTGAGINPARALGPAVVIGKFGSEHWVYWIGPILGAVLAALLYRFIFSAEKPNYNLPEGDHRMSNINSVEVTLK